MWHANFSLQDTIWVDVKFAMINQFNLNNKGIPLVIYNFFYLVSTHTKWHQNSSGNHKEQQNKECCHQKLQQKFTPIGKKGK